MFIFYFSREGNMQHSSATIEDQLVLKAIKEECPWENLPKRVQSTLNSKEEWHRRLVCGRDSCLLLFGLFFPQFSCEICLLMPLSSFRRITFPPIRLFLVERTVRIW